MAVALNAVLDRFPRLELDREAHPRASRVSTSGAPLRYPCAWVGEAEYRVAAKVRVPPPPSRPVAAVMLCVVWPERQGV